MEVVLEGGGDGVPPAVVFSLLRVILRTTQRCTDSVAGSPVLPTTTEVQGEF